MSINRNISTLIELPIGNIGIITSLIHKKESRNRLFEMGLIPGTKIAVTRIAPLGDPLQIYFRGYSLILRRLDASKILVLNDEAPLKGCDM